MVTLRRIGVRSAGRAGFFMGLATSVTNFAFFLFLLVIVHGVPISVIDSDMWRQIGLSCLLSSLIMSFAVGMFAFIYNIAPSIGGLQLEFDMPDAPSSKRKNDVIEDDTIDIV